LRTIWRWFGAKHQADALARTNMANKNICRDTRTTVVH